MNIFTHFFSSKSNKETVRKQAILKDLMRREADLNKNLFGPVPKGTKRDFFNLDKHTWIWYEEWTDDSGQLQQMTTRYVVRPTEILKSQNGGAYFRLTTDEAKNFQKATDSYIKNAKKNLYATSNSTAKV